MRPIPYKLSIIVVYSVVISLAILLAGFIFLNDQRLQNSSERLFNESLPLLRLVGQLRSAKVEHERLLYEYYATTNQTRLMPEVMKLQRASDTLLTQIDHFSLSGLSKAQVLFNQIAQIAGQLDQNLSQDRVDWDLARDQLVTLSQLGRQVEPVLDSLAQAVEAQALSDSDASRQLTHLGTQLVIGFCVAISALTLFVGIFVERYVRETAVRRRLAMFPERNPNPVISVDRSGHITYKNPAAHTLPFSVEKILDLLPVSLDTLWHQGLSQTEGEIEVAPATFAFNLALLKDLDLAHIHLKDITEQVKAESALQFQATHDTLTERPNRSQLELALRHQIRNEPTAFFLVIISLHRFERIVANYGRDFGNQLLTKAVRKMVSTFNQGELLEPGLCRLSDHNFAFILPQSLNDREPSWAINDLLQRLFTAFEQSISIEDNEHFLSLRAGICEHPKDNQTPEGLLKCADNALIKAAQSEGTVAQFYTQELHDQNQKSHIIEAGLRQAIKHQALSLFFQPKVNTQTGDVTGCEALMRWIENDKPKYSPAEFIPVAEQTGLIIDIGEWTLKEAFWQAEQWRRTKPIPIAINLSQRQFQHHNLLPLLAVLQQQYSDIETLIELEITESLLMQDVHTSIHTMNEIKKMGVCAFD